MGKTMRVLANTKDICIMQKSNIELVLKKMKPIKADDLEFWK